MITLARLEGGIVVSTGHTAEEAAAIKALNTGTLVHYITSEVEGEIVPLVSQVTLDDTGIPVATFRSFDSVRKERDKMLDLSDYRDLPSYPGNDQEEWREYRSKLRSLPQDYPLVSEMEFPKEPL